MQRVDKYFESHFSLAMKVFTYFFVTIKGLNGDKGAVSGLLHIINYVYLNECHGFFYGYIEKDTAAGIWVSQVIIVFEIAL